MNRSKETSVLIVNTNQKDYLVSCLESLKPIYLNPNFEIIVIDNNSSDGSPEFIEKNYPSVKLIKTKNKGFCAANNLGAKHSNGKYLILLNPDTKVYKNSLEKLVDNLKNNKDTVTIPKILLYDGSKINTIGAINHFTGLPFTNGLGMPSNFYHKQKYLNALSGACFCIKKEDYIKLGGLDEQFFLYMDDIEFSWRLKCKNYKILYVPESVIYHDYHLRVYGEKIYYLERGRYVILRKYFTWKEFFFFFPSLFITELFTFGYASLNGTNGIKFKLKAMKEGLNLDLEKFDFERKNLVRLLDFQIPEDQLNYNFLDIIFKKIGNLIYFMNYKLFLLIWNPINDKNR